MIQARAAVTPLKSKQEAAAAEASVMTVGAVEAGELRVETLVAKAPDRLSELFWHFG